VGVEEADSKRFGGELWLPPSPWRSGWTSIDRVGHAQTQSLRDHLPVRVTDRASLAGNVSRSSSSSRWSA
jgi:hypothetical protein